MNFKIEALRTFQSIYEVNALTKEEAIDAVLRENSEGFLKEDKLVSVSVKSINGNYSQTEVTYD